MARRQTIGWESVEQLASILEVERDALTAQIEALRSVQDAETPAGRLAAVLCEYLVRGSAKAATDWATSLGWKRPSKNRKGEASMRNFSPDDIYAAIDTPPPELPQPIVDLCRKVYGRNQDLLEKRDFGY